MTVINGLVFTEEGAFESLTVMTEGDRITKTGKDLPPEGEVFDAEGCYVLPGLTDVHFHGCMGHDFCDGTIEALDAIAEYQFGQGVTCICPATMTLPDSRLCGILKNAAEYRRSVSRPDRAELVGVHLEGPFINRERKGAQNEGYIQTADAEKLRRWQDCAEGLVKLVTIAPETENALGCIRECRREFRFSIGHTNADSLTAAEAFRAGADHVTHLFNAMPPFGHRETGVVGAALDEGNCFVELICDGVHISPTMVRAVFRLFGDDRVVLISDSMEAAGMPDGSYSLGGQRVDVKGSLATLADGGPNTVPTIAGSVTSLYKCMLTAVSMGIPLESAVRAAAVNPCRSIGIYDEYGSIAVGKRANFLVLDRNDLSIRAVIKG